MDDPFDLPPDVLRRVPLFAELSKVLSWTGGPVNWDLARQIAVSVAAGEEPGTAVDDQGQAALDDHVRLAERWLADATGLDQPSPARGRALTPVGWAEQATHSLRDLIDPVAAKVSAAMSEQTGAMGGADQAAMLTQALGQMAPMFMGIQAGSILGGLARSVLGAHELGLPSDDDEIVIILPTVDRFATEYALDRTLVRQWVALRATAHRLAFDGFARTRFFALYHDFVASLHFDLGESMRRLQDIDLSDPSRLHDALGDEGLFTAQTSPASRTAARRLSVHRGVIDAAIEAACATAGARAGDVGRVEEAVRRRAAAGDPGAMLTRFIGLEDDAPADAQSFVRTVLNARGWEALGRLWADPTGFPSDDEVADPHAWLERTT